MVRKNQYFFTSKSLTPTQQKYPHIEKEGLAIVHAFQKFHKFIYGKEFILYSDNKPLVYIFAENKPIPVTANQRIQRWALMISAYMYKLKHRKGSDMLLPDYLSRFPLSETDKEPKNNVNFIHSKIRQFLPLNYTHIAEQSKEDMMMSKVMEYVQCCWPHTHKDLNLNAFYTRRHELTVQGGCLLYGDRVVIPDKQQYAVLELLHHNHPGQTRMKLLARSCVWWPNIDRDIVNHVLSCSPCQATQNSEPAGHSKWPEVTARMDRIHMDFAQYKGNTYLVIIDAYSKWIEVYLIPSTSFHNTIKCLNQFFSIHGFCKVINSDNGPPFNSVNFTSYCTERGIQHVLSPPWHPKSNGAAEKAVQTFKNFMKKLFHECNSLSHSELQDKITDFLFSYRNTPSTVTGKCPAELFLNCIPNTLLYQLKPLKFDTSRCKENVKTFSPGECVLVKSTNNSDINWFKGKIVSKVSPFIYNVIVNGREKSCHTEQLKSVIVSRDEGSKTSQRPKVELGSPSKGFATPKKIRRQPESQLDQPHIPADPVSPHSPAAGALPVTPEARAPEPISSGSGSKESQDSSVKESNKVDPVQQVKKDN
jgi:signal peptidase I